MLIVARINCKTSILNDKEVFVGHESETLLNRFLLASCNFRSGTCNSHQNELITRSIS